MKCEIIWDERYPSLYLATEPYTTSSTYEVPNGLYERWKQAVDLLEEVEEEVESLFGKVD